MRFHFKISRKRFFSKWGKIYKQKYNYWKTWKRTTTFINKAEQKFKYRYDYRNVFFVDSYKKIEIGCEKHGAFYQSPYYHLKGRHCPKCARESNNFIVQANKVHNDKYNYENTFFISETKKIEIVCQKHGSFFLKAKEHLEGKGCPKCFNQKQKNKRQKIYRHKNIELFLDQAQNLHSNKFDYSLVKFKRRNERVKIMCKKHNLVFLQTPDLHLKSKGLGCSECQKEHTKSIFNFDDFIVKANQVHGFKYDYDKVHYTNSRTKIEIVCPKHGSFLQYHDHHLRGHGCPHRHISKPAQKIAALLRNLNIEFEVEKSFPELKDKARLRFDFYLPLYNLLIEYDGRHHFEPGITYHKVEDFDNIIRRDKMKDEFAKKNNFELLRIHYKDVRNIQKIILNKLNLEKFEFEEKNYRNIENIFSKEIKPKKIKQDIPVSLRIRNILSYLSKNKGTLKRQDKIVRLSKELGYLKTIQSPEALQLSIAIQTLGSKISKLKKRENKEPEIELLKEKQLELKKELKEKDRLIKVASDCI